MVIYRLVGNYSCVALGKACIMMKLIDQIGTVPLVLGLVFIAPPLLLLIGNLMGRYLFGVYIRKRKLQCGGGPDHRCANRLAVVRIRKGICEETCLSCKSVTKKRIEPKGKFET